VDTDSAGDILPPVNPSVLWQFALARALAETRRVHPVPLRLTAKWPLVVETWLDKKGAALEMTSKLNAAFVSDEFLEDMTKGADLVANMTRSTKKLSTKMSALLQKLRRKEDSFGGQLRCCPLISSRRLTMARANDHADDQICQPHCL
jgi:hypothetical protein